MARTGLYYQAHIPADRCWFFTAVIRCQENLCFDRTLDKERSVFEFFVPAEKASQFEAFMAALAEQGVVRNLQQFSNRFADEQVPLHLHHSLQDVLID